MFLLILSLQTCVVEVGKDKSLQVKSSIRQSIAFACSITVRVSFCAHRRHADCHKRQGGCTNLLATVSCHTSHVPSHTSHVTRTKSYVTRRTSLDAVQVTVGTHVVVATEGTELPSGDVVSKVTCDNFPPASSFSTLISQANVGGVKSEGDLYAHSTPHHTSHVTRHTPCFRHAVRQRHVVLDGWWRR